MFNLKKHILKPPKPFLILTVLILGSLFMTFAFMNCRFNPEVSNDINNQQSSVLEPANYQNIVNELASQYENDLNEACTSFYFLDQVVEALRAEDVNFGYSCQQGDCESISKDSVTFYKGSQTDAEKDLSSVFVIKVIDHVCEEEDTDPSATWNIQSEDVISKWKFPRMNGSQETNSINTDSNCSPENKEALLQELSTTYSQDFSASCEETQNWSFIDRALDRLYSNDNRWGYFCIDGDCNNLSTNTIAYNCGADDSVLSISIVNIIDCDQDSPQLTWVDDTQNLIDTDSDAEVGWRYPRTIYKDISQIIANLRESQDEENSQDLASVKTSSTTTTILTIKMPTTTTTMLTIKMPVNGECGNSVNTCSHGTLRDQADTSTHDRWQCEGTNGGTTASCSKEKYIVTPIPPTTISSKTRINGVCNNSITYGCVAGTSNLKAIADTNTHYRWHCVGVNGGTTATNCQKAKPVPVNGVCNNNQRNSCSAGTANDGAIADTSTYYRWYCEGQYGGITATNCQKAKPTTPTIVLQLPGECGKSVNTCSHGTLRNQADTSTHYRWQCEGTNGGTTASCSKEKYIITPIPPTTISSKTRINGVCNNSITYGCVAGTSNLKAIADTSTYYRWYCEGQYGGTTATNCQKAKPTTPTIVLQLPGECGKSVNTCSHGTLRNQADTSTHYRWQCEGTNGGTTASCSKEKYIITIPLIECGVCGSSPNTCSSGTQHNHPADTTSEYKWTCLNNPNKSDSSCGGRKVECSAPKLVVIELIECGVCGSSPNTCSSGTQHNHPADTTSEYKWTCLNNPNKSDSSCGGRKVECSAPKLVVIELIECGVCGSSPNTCSSGTQHNHPADTTSEYKWTCLNNPNKSDSSCGGRKVECSAPKPTLINN